MNRADPAPTPALTPIKMALIVVLAIVFVVVLVVQFSGGGSASVAIKKRTPRSTPEGATDATNPTSSASAPAIRLHWPEIQRDEVAAFNPFEFPQDLKPKSESIPALAEASQSTQIAQSAPSTSTQTIGSETAQRSPKAEDEPAQIRAKERKSRLERIRATASDLQKQGVGLVVTTSAGAVARIGEQEVRVGDVINGVLRIVDIDPEGIVMEEEPEDTTLK